MKCFWGELQTDQNEVMRIIQFPILENFYEEPRGPTQDNLDDSIPGRTKKHTLYPTDASGPKINILILIDI